MSALKKLTELKTYGNLKMTASRKDLDAAAAELADLEKANKDFFRANFKLTGQIAAKDVASGKAIVQMVKIGNLLNWNKPIDQEYVDALNALKEGVK